MNGVFQTFSEVCIFQSSPGSLLNNNNSNSYSYILRHFLTTQRWVSLLRWRNWPQKVEPTVPNEFKHKLIRNNCLWIAGHQWRKQGGAWVDYGSSLIFISPWDPNPINMPPINSRKNHASDANAASRQLLFQPNYHWWPTVYWCQSAKMPVGVAESENLTHRFGNEIFGK